MVISRQAQVSRRLLQVLYASSEIERDSDRLRFLLEGMFGKQRVHLDHDPPLCLREIIDAEKGIYKPDANDPEFLVYRTAEQHRLKTFVRGDGAQLSDAGKRRKEIKRRRKMESWVRGPDCHLNRWPKGRKLRSRPLGRLRRESTDRRPD